MNSCLYSGWVRHRRHTPTRHAFRYRLFQVYLDLDELDDVFRGAWLWSTRGPNVAWLRRRDHLGPPDQPLADAVRDLVEERLGRRPTGAIRLLTHLRYFGYAMNPVSFFYCFDADGGLDAVVEEIHNTPWGERYCYVLDASRQPAGQRFRFGKEFHVSPFMSMDHEYEVRVGVPGERLVVHMENHRAGERILDVTLVMTRKPMTAGHRAACLARHPFMTGKVIIAIYWQALRLWLKRTPFHAHPKTLEAS